MIVDEIQTGLGRTGEWFGFQHDGVVPDVVALAKALGNGMPVGACWAKDSVAAVFEPGDHGSTYSATAIATSAVNAVIGEMRRIDAPRLAHERGAVLAESLAAIPGVSEVRGRGLLLAAELERPRRPRRVSRVARPRGSSSTRSGRPRSAWPRRSRCRRRDPRGGRQIALVLSMNLVCEIADLSADQIDDILGLARRPVAELGRPLDGQGAALIFEKASTRTRHSTEMAVVQLGGHPVYTRGDEIGMDVRESVEDIVRILEGYHRVIAARVYDHRVLERMAAGGVGADREPAVGPRPPVAGARRRTDDGARLRAPRRPPRRLGGRLQQRGPIAGRDHRAASAGTSPTPARLASSRARPSSNACCCSVRRAPSITGARRRR